MFEKDYALELANLQASRRALSDQSNPTDPAIIAAALAIIEAKIADCQREMRE